MRIDSSGLIKFIEENYDLGKINTIERIQSGVTNTNFVLATESKKYVLRIQNIKKENTVDNVIPFMEYAESINFPCPKIVISKVKKEYFIIAKKLFMIMSFESGIQCTLETINDSKIAAFSEVLAKLHSLDWQPKKQSKSLGIKYVFEHYRKYMPKMKKSDFENKTKFIDDTKAEYNYQSKIIKGVVNKLPQCVIHNDPTPWNVLFLKDKLASLVDLEDVGVGTRLFDLARAINIWCFVDDKLDIGRLKIFMDSYLEVVSLTDYEKVSLPIILRFIAFRHCCYFMRMYSRGKHHNPSDSIDYDCLKYYRKIGNKQIEDLVFGK